LILYTNRWRHYGYGYNIRAIVSARKLPLSIVIVGVGGADFTSMNILDADDDPLTMVSFFDFYSYVNLQE
jgi:hypothetical protein